MLLPDDRLLTELERPPPELLLLLLLLLRGRDFTVELEFRLLELPPDRDLTAAPESRLVELRPEGFTVLLRERELGSDLRELLPGRTWLLRLLRSDVPLPDRELQIRVPFLRGSTVLMFPLPEPPRDRTVVPGLVSEPLMRERLPMDPEDPPRMTRSGVLVRSSVSLERPSAPAALCRMPSLLLRVLAEVLPPSRILSPGFPRTRDPPLRSWR